jgi:hypothetical protein
MVMNFKFIRTIQSFGNGGIWVGSCFKLMDLVMKINQDDLWSIG